MANRCGNFGTKNRWGGSQGSFRGRENMNKFRPSYQKFGGTPKKFDSYKPSGYANGGQLNELFIDFNIILSIVTGY